MKNSMVQMKKLHGFKENFHGLDDEIRGLNENSIVQMIHSKVQVQDISAKHQGLSDNPLFK